MSQPHPIRLVTGAPGSGKSAAAQALLALESQYVVLDMDRLIGPASVLADVDLRRAEDRWPSYNALWLEVLHLIELNVQWPVLFTPIAPSDLRNAIPEWCSDVHWLRLDCDDSVRTERLRARGENPGSIEAALKDAEELRRQVKHPAFDTTHVHPEIVREEILEWLDSLTG